VFMIRIGMSVGRRREVEAWKGERGEDKSLLVVSPRCQRWTFVLLRRHFCSRRHILLQLQVLAAIDVLGTPFCGVVLWWKWSCELVEVVIVGRIASFVVSFP
jgi:hypothetical protein